MIMMDAQWCNALGVSDIDGINDIIRTGKAKEMVSLCEARHESLISEIAARIVEEHYRLVLIAGPSSSGKTSTSLRLAAQCKVHGMNPKAIELDDYFVPRDRTPRKPDGSYDFESLDAMDTELLENHLRALVMDEEIELPKYNFVDGTRTPSGRKMHLEQKDVLILEGIHAIDPAMTPYIPDDLKFCVFVSDVSSISEYEPDIQLNDNRLLRRMVRDARGRGHSPESTLKMWPSVREGEEKYIFPFMEKANAVFNSTLQYELPLLKLCATSPLMTVKEDSEQYAEAQRLLNVLQKVDPLPLDAILSIPVTSIMREFIGWQILSRDLL